ncbi:hypothetical protein QM150_00390 [Klebsiella pneumoniae]
MSRVADGRPAAGPLVTLMAELGYGLFGAPSAEGHRQQIRITLHSTTSEVRHEGQTLIPVAKDPQDGQRLQSTADIAATAVATARHHLGHLLDEPTLADRLCVALEPTDSTREVMAFHGRWIREFLFRQLTLEHDSVRP